jgi:Ca-activated chloride channel family protein
MEIFFAPHASNSLKEGETMKTKRLLTISLLISFAVACQGPQAKRGATEKVEHDTKQAEDNANQTQPEAVMAREAPAESKPAKYGIAGPSESNFRGRTAGMVGAFGTIGNGQEFNTEAYDHIQENKFYYSKDEPLSTFSIDVDTASYANVRRFLAQQGELPPKDAVRIEELLNYFRYEYAPPTGEHPFAVHIESATAPWNKTRRLVRIGVKATEIDPGKRGPANLVFLLDVSGSMNQPNKLPLLKRGMKMLVEQLDNRDRVAIVVYAGASGVVLPSTRATDRTRILEALERLRAGGSTNGGAGIQLAYDIAGRHFVRGGVNRVILATDGDFNVGTTSRGDLVRLIEEKRASDVFLSVLGFGTGNYKDAALEELARNGNGTYAYVDSLLEARKVLVEEMGGTLVTVAKDVKIQVEFNPAKVQAYRLIGYENRMLDARDFNDDRKDAGEIGAGHTVTALYEVVPPGTPIDLPGVDPLKYRSNTSGVASGSNELLTVKLRYKQPTGKKSTKFTIPFEDTDRTLATASDDLRFAAAVAGFGMLLRESEHAGNLTYADVSSLARSGMGPDVGAYRAEFLRLVEVARTLQ